MTLVFEHPPEFRLSGIRRWWRALDKPLLAAIVFLFCAGLVLAFSTSPVIAIPQGKDPFYYATRQMIFAVPAVVLFVIFSSGTPKEIRRLGVILFGIAVLMLLVVLLFGEERNGSKRWISFIFFAVQPSELVKPALIAVSAWMFSLRPSPGAPSGVVIATVCIAIVALLVALQPDYSQTALICAVWGAMFFLTGASILWAVSAVLLGFAGVAIAYAVSPYVAVRLRLLFDAQGSGGGQIRRAIQAIQEGGLYGTGPGEGVRKFRVPDAHSDFVIAVVAEEFGLVLAVVIIAIFAFITVRSLLLAARIKNAFARYSVSGIAALIGFQAFIHIGVAARIVPPTGMTLPLISYGGSSLLAMGIAFGMLLGLTRSDIERFQERRRP